MLESQCNIGYIASHDIDLFFFDKSWIPTMLIYLIVYAKMDIRQFYACTVGEAHLHHWERVCSKGRLNGPLFLHSKKLKSSRVQ